MNDVRKCAEAAIKTTLIISIKHRWLGEVLWQSNSRKNLEGLQIITKLTQTHRYYPNLRLFVALKNYWLQQVL